MKQRKSSFHPINELEDKSNYKIYARIEKDGTIIERVFLDIPIIELREEIICLHYLKKNSEWFRSRPTTYTIVSRDNPWDFRIEIDSNTFFNVEITSISDDRMMFEKLKREERIAVKQHLEKIPFHEVIKLNNFFPSDNVTKLIQEFKENGTTNNELVDNPYHENAPRLFLSSIDEEKKPLEEKLKDVIQKKENKKHADKEDTILIIDNRTLTYEIEDLFLAILKLDNFLSECSFKEIWFYTGYYSNVDGEKAEYSLSPLKISEYQTEIIQKLTELNKPNEDGLFFT